MDDVRVARVTHQILLAAVGVLVLLILTSPLLNPSPLLPALIYAAFLIVILSALVLVRRGRFRMAGIISCVALWVMATALVVSEGGLRGHSLITYVVVVLVAGFFWSERAAVVLAILTSLAGLLLWGFESAGQIPDMRQQVSLGRIWIGLTAAAGMTAAVVHFALRGIRSAILEAQRSERKFAQLVQGAPDGIAVFNPEGLIIETNAELERLFGYSRPELIGRGIEELLPERFRDSHRSHRDHFSREPIAREVGDALSVRGRRKDGSEFPAEITLSPVQMEAGIVVVSSIRDITKQDEAERKRSELEEQLRQSQKLESVGHLAGGIAHDFNNLLTVILGNTSLELSDQGSTVDSHFRAKEIQAAAERAAALTAQLLAFSRKQVLNPEPLQLHHVVSNVTTMLRRLIGENIELSVAGSEANWIEADPSQIEQVLINLAVNARDAMPRGGILRIETTEADLDAEDLEGHPEIEPGPYAMLEVSDTGSGMDEEIKLHLFEPFFTTKERGRGTGLGLATVHGIVHQSGGHIRVDSTPGEGTTFRLLFPRIEDPTLVIRAEAPAVAAALQSSTILLVEDDDNVREVTQRILEAGGCRVLAAAGHDAAMELWDAHSESIDLLLSDVVLSRSTSAKLVENMRKDREDLNVLYVSGHAEDTIAQHGVLVGEVDFLAKPFTIKALTERVGEILSRSQG